MKKIILDALIFCSCIHVGVSQQLLFKGFYKEWNNGVTGLYLSQSVEFSPDGKNCYVGSYSGFTWYTIDTTTKTVSLSGNLEEGKTGGPAVLDGHGVVVSPDGKNVYTAVGYQRNSVCVYSRDQATGAPTYSSKITEGDNGITDMTYPYDVDITPDGKFLYVPCQASSSLLWFSRDAATGNLTYVAKLVDGVDGADGLANARNVDISPDGKNVYVVASGDNSISAYSINSSTGNLTRISLIKQGDNGADCLSDTYWVEVSPDGKFVYAASQSLGGISWFTRNEQTGEIAYGGCLKGISGCRGLAMHPSGKWIFASASYSNSVVWLERNSSTGALTKSGSLEDGSGGVDGINNTRYNAISPKGNVFVATGYGENGFAYFEWKDNTTGIQNLLYKTTPNEFSLSQNFPNPFNPSTTISYRLSARGAVSLKVYDILGKEVAILVNETNDAGTYSVKFDASKLSSGIYFARFQNGARLQSKKMLLMK